jgi:hypothetical protein
MIFPFLMDVVVSYLGTLVHQQTLFYPVSRRGCAKQKNHFLGHKA